MRTKTFLNVLLLGFVIFSSGCASIVKGRYQEVSFQSMPDGATVTVDGRTLGKTPITANLLKSSGRIIIFEKDGYKPLTMSLETRMSGWFWGNIVLGGFLGSSTDAATGAINEYSPSQYMVTLQPMSSNQIAAAVQRPQGDRVKEFVIVGYANLRADLNAGSGQYLTSLLELLGIGGSKRQEKAILLKNLATKYPNVMEFAEQVAALFTTTESNGNTSWDGMDCDKYYCMTLEEPAFQARRISQLQKSVKESDQAILANIIKDAKKRITNCSNGDISVSPGVNIDQGEKDFLEHLCRIGKL